MSTPESADSLVAARDAKDQPLLASRHRGLLLFGVILVSLCQFFDATIANVALPHMKTALGASSESIGWVLTSFMIATAIGTPITGWLSDYFGSRNVFMIATVAFLLSSAACGASVTLPEMVTFRILQGLASAFIGPLTMTIMFDISPPSKQATAMSIYGMMVMVAPITGPFIGAFLTEYLSWRWIYYVNLPLGIPALVLLWWLLPCRPIVKRKLDLFGYVAIAVALGALQLMFDRGQGRDWFSSREIVFELIIALSALWIFVVHSRGHPHPLFRPTVFANRNFLAGLAFMAILGATSSALAAILPTMFQTLYQYPVMDTGLLMAPRGLGVVCTSLLASYLSRKYDSRLVILSGYLIAAAGTWTMTQWTLDMGTMPILFAAFVQGIGFGVIVTPVQLMAYATLDPSLRPDASSLTGLSRSFGGSVGISVIFTLLSRNQQISHADLASHITAATVPGLDLPAAVARMEGLGNVVMAMIDAEVQRQSMMIAYLDSFYVLTWLMLAFAPVPLLMKKARRPKRA